MKRQGFTLLELLISISIAAMVAAVVYFGLDTALDSWGYTRDQLAIQKILNEVAEEITAGGIATYGLRDSLEVINAGRGRVEFVPPWTDDTHSVVSKSFTYTLDRRLKPGTSVPIGEIRFPEDEEYQFVPVELAEAIEPKKTKVRLKLAAPSGSQIRLIYHPDPEANSDVIKTVWYDRKGGAIYSQYADGTTELSKNFLGVEITDFRLKYFDNTNTPITEFEWVGINDLNMITGIEIYIEAELGGYTKSILSFVSLRNAPLHSGYLALRKGTRIPIPDSDGIHTLLLTNLSGIENGDILEHEAVPVSGRTWRVRIEFSRKASSAPKIEKLTIEYPAGHPKYTEYPRMGTEAGLNLLTIDTSGLYDYDNDEDIKDFVSLKGDTMLEVKKMDLEGVGLFVRP